MGLLVATRWQAVAPHSPNANAGGDVPKNPGIKRWLEGVNDILNKKK